MPVADRHAVNGTPLEGAVSRRPRAGGVRPRLFLGRRAEVLAAAGRLHDGRRLRRRLHEEPDVRGSVLRPNRAHRGRARRVRSRTKVSYERSAEECSGRTTTRRRGCARATTSARSTGRRSTRISDAQRAAAEASRDRVRGRRSRRSGFRPITTEIRDAPPFYYAEDYHQQYLAKNPNGYCGIGGTGVKCV